MEIDFGFVLTDANASETNSFKYGEDIFYSFEIDNRTSDTPSWEGSCVFIRDMDIYSTYSYFESKEGESRRTFKGRPYQEGLGCYYNLQLLKPGKHNYLEHSWNANNSPLPVGDYIVEFDVDFQLQEPLKSLKQSVYLHFQVVE